MMKDFDCFILTHFRDRLISRKILYILETDIVSGKFINYIRKHICDGLATDYRLKDLATDKAVAKLKAKHQKSRGR